MHVMGPLTPVRRSQSLCCREHACACQEEGAKHASLPLFSQDLQFWWLDAEFPRLCNKAGLVWSWCVKRGEVMERLVLVLKTPRSVQVSCGDCWGWGEEVYFNRLAVVEA